ncbi:MAG TPA: hypothetical protein VER17_16430 [Tepidisphaeraceae bacterium]|nr:hypothetical protein [Tepidisphaeraceae bacterium]
MSETTIDQRRWYVSQGAQRYGPYPTDVLVDWIVAGRVARDALISDGGPWVPAGDLVEQAAREAVARARLVEPPPLPGSDAPPPPAPTPAAHLSAPAPAVAAAPAAQQKVDDAPPERDRIVVIGRRQSGKTIFLASVYAKLWRSLNGVTAKALSGDVHRQLMLVHNTLKQGEWPAATLGTSRMEMEIEHGGRTRLMVTLDFAGELFRKAFVEEQADFPGVRELQEHIDRAAAVIMLIDPSVVAGLDHDAAMDDDFGIVQAVHRIRNWPGGEAVPIVLVLTKMDQHQQLLDRFGTAKEFVRTHFPALVRTLKQIPIFQVSAVQVEPDAQGRPRPRGDSLPINIDAPLQYCLRALHQAEERTEQDRMDRQRQLLEMRLEREEQERERRQNFLLIFTISTIIVLGAAAAVAIIMWKV